MKNDKGSKEEKFRDQAQEVLEDYGAADISDPQTAEVLQRMSESLVRSGLRRRVHIDAIDWDSNRDLQKRIDIYTRGVFAQNFIIIRQLDEILCRLKGEASEGNNR